MLPSYSDYIFVHLRQKARLRPEILSTLGGLNLAQTRLKEPGPTYNSGGNMTASNLHTLFQTT